MNEPIWHLVWLVLSWGSIWSALLLPLKQTTEFPDQTAEQMLKLYISTNHRYFTFVGVISCSDIMFPLHVHEPTTVMSAGGGGWWRSYSQRPRFRAVFRHLEHEATGHSLWVVGMLCSHVGGDRSHNRVDSTWQRWKLKKVETSVDCIIIHWPLTLTYSLR